MIFSISRELIYLKMLPFMNQGFGWLVKSCQADNLSQLLLSSRLYSYTVYLSCL